MTLAPVEDRVECGVWWFRAHPDAARFGFDTSEWAERIVEAWEAGEFNMADPCGCAVGVSAGSYTEFLTVEILKIDPSWELVVQPESRRLQPRAMHAAESACRDVAIEHGFLWALGESSLELAQVWVDRAQRELTGGPGRGGPDPRTASENGENPSSLPTVAAPEPVG